MIIDFWSLKSQNSIKQIDFNFELLDMYENWCDKSKIRFINVCIDNMPEEMNQLIDEKEWDSPMEFLIGAIKCIGISKKTLKISFQENLYLKIYLQSP